MNRQFILIFVIVTLLLALIIFFTYRQYPEPTTTKKKETFVNTQSCLKLSSDEISTATKICSNFSGMEATNCINMITAAACPLENSIAKNALPVDGNVQKKSQTDLNMEYNNSTDLEKKTFDQK